MRFAFTIKRFSINTVSHSPYNFLHLVHSWFSLSPDQPLFFNFISLGKFDRQILRLQNFERVGRVRRGAWFIYFYFGLQLPAWRRNDGLKPREKREKKHGLKILSTPRKRERKSCTWPFLAKRLLPMFRTNFYNKIWQFQ